jgi:sugar phosphate isomerase/epimerase
MMNRREFNHFAGLGSIGFVSRFAAAYSFDYPWKLGIITDEVDPNLKRTLSTFYPKYGLKWAEIRNVKLDGKSQYVYKSATPPQLKQIATQLDDAGVRLSVLDTAVYKDALPGTKPVDASEQELNAGMGDFAAQLDELKRAAHAAHTLGTNKLRIFTFLRVVNPDSVFPQILENLNKALAIARQEDLLLLVENEFSCNTATGSESGKLLRAISDPRLKLNWDPGNCFVAGEQPFPRGWDAFDHSRIGHIHLKDAAGKSWRPVGGGQIDFIGQFKALKKMQYSETMSLETHYRNAQHDLYQSSVESMDGLFKVLKEV